MSVQRLLTKLMSAPTLLTPAPSTKGLGPLAKALASMPDPEKEDKGVHPHHVRIALDREDKSILGKIAHLMLCSTWLPCQEWRAMHAVCLMCV